MNRKLVAALLVVVALAVVVLAGLPSLPVSGFTSPTVVPTPTATPAPTGGVFPAPAGIVSATVSITDSEFTIALSAINSLLVGGDASAWVTETAFVRFDGIAPSYGWNTTMLSPTLVAMLDELYTGYTPWRIQGYYVDGPTSGMDVQAPVLYVILASPDEIEVASLPDGARTFTPTFRLDNAAQGIEQRMSVHPTPPASVATRAHVLVWAPTFNGGGDELLAWFVADNYYAVVNGLSFFGTYYVVRP